MREANQAGSFQPITWIAIEVSVCPIFDGTDAARLAAHSFDPAAIAHPDWRRRALQSVKPPRLQGQIGVA
jgi:hypothetical protein